MSKFLVSNIFLGSVLSAGLVALLWLIGYAAMPTLGFGYVAPYFLLAAFGVGEFFIFLLLHSLEDNDNAATAMAATVSMGLAAASVIALIGIGIFATSGLFHASAYRKLIGPIHKEKFSAVVQPIDLKQIPVVKRGEARQLANKQIASYGSSYSLGSMTKCNYKGRLYWVAPLEFAHPFWAWYDDTTSPAFVMVSAVNPDDVRVVTHVDGHAVHLRYLTSAWFGDNVQRVGYHAGHMTRYLTDYSFEVNDKGEPRYVATWEAPTIGFSGYTVKGVAVINPETGAARFYKVGHVPSWVDNIYPVSLVVSQLNDRGGYIHGWWNPSHQGEYATTEGSILALNAHKRFALFTGIQSVSADQGIQALAMIDTRTKKVHWFKVNGAKETAAMASAESIRSEKHYHATFPIIANVEGRPTYVMALLDDNDLPRLFAMVSVKNFQIAAVGSSLSQTLTQYLSSLAQSGGGLDVNANVRMAHLTGVVSRIRHVYDGSNTLFYLMLKGGGDHIYTGKMSQNANYVMTQPGDSVRIDFQRGARQQVINILRFHNLTLRPAR